MRRLMILACLAASPAMAQQATTVAVCGAPPDAPIKPGTTHFLTADANGLACAAAAPATSSARKLQGRPARQEKSK
jgi:hypothetical protein